MPGTKWDGICAGWNGGKRQGNPAITPFHNSLLFSHGLLTRWGCVLPFCPNRVALETALEVYKCGKDASFRQAEIARSSWKMGQVLQQLNRPNEALGYLEEAERIREEWNSSQEVIPGKEKATEASYNKMVSLWAQ